MFGGGFNATKLKPQLKMACGRIQIASNKKTALLKQSTREIATMLSEDPPKEEKARIRVEALIRDDHLIEAYEILILNCELLYERIKLITYNKHCPTDLIGVISTIIWASHRVDIEELTLIRKQFVAKYGKAFEENAMKNEHGLLNERVVMKLSIEPPPAYLVQSYLEKICEQYHVDWTPSYRLSANDMIEPMQPPTGYSIVPSATGTGYGPSSATSTNTNMNMTTMSNSTTATTTNPTIPIVTGELMLPPAVPSKGQQQQQQQIFQPPPPPPPPTTTNTTPTVASATIMDDNEPDIVIPSQQQQDQYDSGEKSPYIVPPPSNHNYTTDNKNDNTDNINNNNDDMDDNDTYHQLAARFNQLKK